ncbi:FliM/FliN family flagellar motor switch protein [Roseovarius ramblicola]|uniref:FliM/FliN family flagellar motor switch protein n=1 Tax=Roseovarius ramblicola TaxID=2022336 RepID=A0ABV5I3A6_9RHOB
MAQQRQASVIRRKTRAAREGADPRVMSPVRALRLALARAADTLYDLPLVVATVEQRRVEAGEVEAALGTDGLFVLLDGAAGARAAMRLCPGLVSALVEVQTTGRVRPGEVRPRAPTRTDAAMVAPLVDALLSGFDDGMCDGSADHARRGFHFGDRVEDARALSLLMVVPEFDVFRLTADLGPGLRAARLDLLLPPAPAPPARGAGAPPPGGTHRGTHRGTEARGPEDLATVALAAPVALDAVVARIRLPLSDAMALEVGQRLAIAKDSLGRVRLLGAGGHVAAEGRLGRRGAWRALRLSGADAQDGDGPARPGTPPGAGGVSGGARKPPPGAPAQPAARPVAGPETQGPETQGRETQGPETQGPERPQRSETGAPPARAPQTAMPEAGQAGQGGAADPAHGSDRNGAAPVPTTG